MKTFFKRLISFFFSVIFAFSFISIKGVLPVAYAATAGHTQEEAVAYTNSLVFAGNKLDYDRNGAWCIDLIHYYYNYLGHNNPSGNANTYDTNALPAGWIRVYSNPQPGDIYQTDAGYYGHVAVVTEIRGSNIVVVQQSGNTAPFASVVAASSATCYIRPDFLTIKNIQSENARTLYTKVDNALVREGPGKKYPVKRTIPAKGTEVKVTDYTYNEYNHLWFKTTDCGWIYSERVCKPKTYTVKYNTNGSATIIPSQIKKENQTIKLTSIAPVRPGYIFLGWNEKQNADTGAYKSGADFSKNKSVTLYAIWRKSATSISLSTSFIAPILNINSQKQKTVNISLAGYIPSGAKLVAKFEKANTGSAAFTSINKNFDLNPFSDYAKASVTITPSAECQQNIYISLVYNNTNLAIASVYMVACNQYTVSFDANSGTNAPGSVTKFSNDSILLPTGIPEKTVNGKSYTFMGWSKDRNATVGEYGPGDIYKENGNKKLYAVWCEDYGVTWRIENGDTLVIDGLGDMACYGPEKAPWYNLRNSIINIKIRGKVMSIGSYAFYKTAVMLVSIESEGFHSISNNAFENCRGLKEIRMPHNVRIGNSAFKNCSALTGFDWSVVKSGRKAVAITASEDFLPSIGSNAFEGCESLETINIPNNVSEIGAGAFQGCKSLKEIELPESVNTVEDLTFFGCESLEDIEIPNTVTEIGAGAFQSCAELTEIEIPDSVTEIGSQSFSGCTSLEKVEIPENVELIGDSVFSNCTSLKEVDLPESISSLGDGMFSGCSSIKEIDIPELVDRLGSGTFLGCTSLGIITIPDGVQTIESSTFFGCSSLKEITIPETTGVIDDYAFCGCSSLEIVDFGTQVTSIGNAAFAECRSLKIAVLPDCVSEIGEAAFLNCSRIEKVYLGASGIKIGNEAFCGCTSLSDISLPEGTSEIGDNVFKGSSCTVTCFKTSPVYEKVSQSLSNVETIVPVENISFTKEEINLAQGETVTLNVKTDPVDATNKNYKLINCSPDIIEITENGKVTVLASGDALVNAVSEDGKKIAECTINCSVPVKRIKIIHDYDTLPIGTSIPLITEFTPANPTNINTRWSSSNKKVATVDENGLLVTKATGKTTITVTSVDGGYTDTFVIKVAEPDYSDETLRFPTVSIKNYKGNETRNIDYGTTIKISAVVKNDFDGLIVKWYKNGKPTVTGQSFTMEKAKKDFTLQAVITDEFGNIYSKSEIENIKVKNDFFTIIIAFFRELIRRSPSIEQ